MTDTGPEVRLLFEAGPPPMASRARRLLLLWSAKAGCTFAVRWYLDKLGLLEEAEALDPWVHEYRDRVYYGSADHRAALEDPGLAGYRAVKLVRDPLERCVSSYLSYCRQANGTALGRAHHLGVLAALEEHLGRPLGPGATFTFREFVAFLGGQDLGACDIHYRLQTHPLERAGVLRDLTILRLEDSLRTLPGFEARHGLRPSALEQLRILRHHTRRTDETDFCGDVRFLDALLHPVPAGRYFYDEELEATVRDLYAEDLARYGY